MGEILTPAHDSRATAETTRHEAALLLQDDEPVNRAILSTPDMPATYYVAVHHRALRLCGFDPELRAPGNPRRLLREGWRHSRRMRHDRLVVTHQGYGCFALGFCRLLRSQPRFILHSTKIPFSVPYTGHARLKTRLNDRVLERTIRAASLVVLNSLEQVALLEEQQPGVSAMWLPCAQDVEWWKPGPLETDVLEPLGIRPGEFVLCVGDVDRNESLPALLAKRLGRPLVRVTRIEKTAANARATFAEIGLADAHCLSRIPYRQLRDLYRSAWAVLNTPFRTDHPAGLTGLLEGMACGAPLLFPAGPTSQGHATDGVDAILYEGNTVDDVLDAARRLSSGEFRTNISRAARERCERELNLDSVAARLVARMEELGLTADRLR